MSINFFLLNLKEWTDYKLKWNPENYGNITKIKIPTSKIWLVDIVLYNK